MRLRKCTVKTQIIEPSKEFSRFKLVKRQATELIILPSHKSIDCDRKMHHVRHSSQLTSNTFDIKFSKSLKPNWKRVRIPFNNARPTNEAVQQHKSNEVDLLNAHLANVSRRAVRTHQRTVTEPCISLKSSRTRKEKERDQPMQRSNYQRCCLIVDEIYAQIKLLRELGYADFKINEWILAYCESRRPYMKEVLMKNISKSLYTLQEEYQFQKSSAAVKYNLQFKVEKGRESFFFVQADQLQQFYRYLQEILIQKNRQKAKEVESSIVQKLSPDLVPRLKNKFFVFTKKEPAQVSNFLTDLNHHQHKYGDFESLSKVNKLRFLELNRVQSNLKKVYHELLDSEIRKFVRDNHERKTGQSEE